VTIDSAGVIA